MMTNIDKTKIYSFLLNISLDYTYVCSITNTVNNWNTITMGVTYVASYVLLGNWQ